MKTYINKASKLCAQHLFLMFLLTAPTLINTGWQSTKNPKSILKRSVTTPAVRCAQAKTKIKKSISWAEPTDHQIYVIPRFDPDDPHHPRTSILSPEEIELNKYYIVQDVPNQQKQNLAEQNNNDTNQKETLEAQHRAALQNLDYYIQKIKENKKNKKNKKKIKKQFQYKLAQYFNTCFDKTLTMSMGCSPKPSIHNMHYKYKSEHNFEKHAHILKERLITLKKTLGKRTTIHIDNYKVSLKNY